MSNYSFKPNPLRGTAYVPTLRLHAFAATARVGLTQVLAVLMIIVSHKIRSPFFALLLAGCAQSSPATLSPDISGSLTIDQNLAANVDVYLGFTGSYDKPCPANPTTRTNADGLFHIPTRTTRRATEKMNESFLCFKINGKLVQATMMLTERSETRKHVADCRLPVPPDARDEDTQVCKWRYG